MEASITKATDLATMGHPSYTLTKELLLKMLQLELTMLLMSLKEVYRA